MSSYLKKKKSSQLRAGFVDSIHLALRASSNNCRNRGDRVCTLPQKFFWKYLSSLLSCSPGPRQVPFLTLSPRPYGPVQVQPRPAACQSPVTPEYRRSKSPAAPTTTQLLHEPNFPRCSTIRAAFSTCVSKVDH